jgi:hypothetical protein
MGLTPEAPKGIPYNTILSTLLQARRDSNSRGVHERTVVCPLPPPACKSHVIPRIGPHCCPFVDDGRLYTSLFIYAYSCLPNAIVLLLVGLVHATSRGAFAFILHDQFT